MVYAKIRALCKDRGLTIAKLERDTALTPKTIYTWQKRWPRSDKLKRVADYLGKPMEYFMKED